MIYSKEIWGPKAWNLLHAFTMNNSLKINNKKKHQYYIFYISFIYILPCDICSKHYEEIIYYINPLIEKNINKEYLTKWVFDCHNTVNSLLSKKEYEYNKFIENYKINNNDIYFTLYQIYNNLDYTKISLFKYDNIFNFFLNFCILYPNKCIRINLKELINSNDFKKIITPNDFKIWFKENILKIKNIILSNKSTNIIKEKSNISIDKID